MYGTFTKKLQFDIIFEKISKFDKYLYDRCRMGQVVLKKSSRFSSGVTKQFVYD